jgi:hypothetical protein
MPINRSKCGAAIVAILFLAVTAMGQVPRNTLGNRPASGRFYFGTSQNQKHCPSAWLLYLDKEHNTGGIFDVPAMENFEKLELSEDGTLLFQWCGLGDNNYRFNGTLKADRLVGEVQLIEARSGSTKYLCDMVATALSSQYAHGNPERQVLAGRFSNTTYSSEGGDLNGVDARFFSTSEGTKGMIVFYGDSWDEPLYTPLALTQIEADKGTIRFAAETPNGLVHYHLRLTHIGGLLNRDDVAQKDGVKNIPLKKSLLVLPAIFW